jgi:hypothetical protein
MNDQDPTQRYEAPPAVPQAPPPPPGHEDVPGASAPTAPVTATPAGRPGRSRLRWLIALVVVALVAGTAAGATLMLTASAGDPEVLAWVPADTTAYGELRLDLPGGQQAELSKVLSAFPGFADQASFGTKLGEIGDRLIKAATDGKHDYQSEIAPWFGGQLAVAQGPGPTSAEIESGAFGSRVLILARVTDTAKATAWIDKMLAESGASVASETYNGTPITMVRAGSGDGAMGSTEAGYAVLGTVVAMGDTRSLKAAIDTKGTEGLAKDPQFRSALDAVSGDRLLFGYTDVSASFDSSVGMMRDFDTDGTLTALMGLYGKITPPWVAFAVRAADGNLVMDQVSPHVATFGAPANHASSIAGLVPADTLLLTTGNDVGARLEALRQLVADEPKLAEPLGQVDQALGILGGFDAVTGWMGDFGVAVTRNGDAVDGGLLVVPTDRAAADRMFTTIRSLITLGAGSAVTFEEEAHGDATIVSVDLGDIGSMAPAMGLGTIPGNLELAYAVTDQVVVIGVGKDFVKAVLDARTGDSLAKQPRFSSLVEKAGAQNSGVMWVDAAAVRDLVVPLIPSDERARYDTDIKPYLEPIDAIGGVTIAGAELDRGTFILTVSH